jgi:crotonobetainyl-CoA:carnitine CoA-transferase CaiB-like acyl-CoA transferase
MTPPLHGIRVLDVTNVLAGPFCSFQLVLMGAEVIKVEQPGSGDLARRLGADPEANGKLMGASFVSVNAGKQSVTLNLKAPEGKKIFKELVAISDAVVENFRPGVMNRLGLDYSTLAGVNPRLVYCAISGFGMDGPLAMRPAYDQVIQGISGVMSVTGDERSAPMRAGYPVCDTFGGITGAMAICGALVGAQMTGQGRMIDVSMLEATLASMGWVVSNYLNVGVKPIPMGNENFTAAPSGLFRTAQGLLNIAANEDAQYHKLCELIGRPDLKTDPRFEDRETRRGNRLLMNAEIAPELMKRSAADWEKVLTDAGVPAGCVLSVPEILNHPQISGRKFVSRFEGSTGKQEMTRGGFVFLNDDASPTGPAPELSEHTAAWLTKLGYNATQIAALRQKRIV